MVVPSGKDGAVRHVDLVFSRAAREYFGFFSDVRVRIAEIRYHKVLLLQTA